MYYKSKSIKLKMNVIYNLGKFMDLQKMSREPIKIKSCSESYSISNDEFDRIR